MTAIQQVQPRPIAERLLSSDFRCTGNPYARDRFIYFSLILRKKKSWRATRARARSACNVDRIKYFKWCVLSWLPLPREKLVKRIDSHETLRAHSYRRFWHRSVNDARNPSLKWITDEPRRETKSKSEAPSARDRKSVSCRTTARRRFICGWFIRVSVRSMK
jgi:hypothetical protein